MKLLAASLATAVTFAAITPASTTVAQATFADPANLRGERPVADNGSELPIAKGAYGLQQMLRKINTRASLMLIVAHPDDEDGGMLTLYSRGVGARVATLTLTRGEGGQNAMTGDFEDALGLLRTQELLAADRYMGVDQMFGTEVDFGFSKTKEESFKKWTHERVLYDAVRSVRLYRPLVIAAVFIGGVTDGHGQHQVSGEIAQEVFKAAGDPKVFPELTAEGIFPWQPLKVYARVPMQAITPQGLFDYATGQYAPARFTNYVTGEVTTTPPSSDVVVHEGGMDPLLTNASAGVPSPYTDSTDPTAFYAKRLSYVQFARLGLGLQRSQIGPNVRLPPAGVFDIAYHRYGSRLDAAHQKQEEQSFFDGIDTSLEGIASLAPAAGFLPSALHALSAEVDHITRLDVTGLDAKTQLPNTEVAAAPLAEALKHADEIIARIEQASLPAAQKHDVLHELRIKRVQLNDALVYALGLQMDTEDNGLRQFANTALELRPRVYESGDAKLQYVRGWSENSHRQGLPIQADTATAALAPASPITPPCRLTAQQTPVTRPYFFRDNIEQPVYQLHDPAFRNAPATPPALTCWAQVQYHGAKIEVGSILTHEVVPALNLHLYEHAEVLPQGESSFPVRGSIEPQNVKLSGLGFETPPGWTATKTRTTGSYFQYRIDAVPPPSAPVVLQATATLASDGKQYKEGYVPACYPGILCTNYFTPATLRVVPVDVKLPVRRRIAYVLGTGDAVAASLISLGLQPITIRVEDLTAEKLARFDTVVLGVRTYNAHPELHGAATEALLAFARSGGNVIVQYQTAEFTASDAPYPLTLGNAEKVVDETDAVKLVDPVAPLFSSPNRITPADFNGWFEERGHGFLHTWDPRYTALTETADPGQEPQRGGLITVQLGRGHWTYCAFALYRQLPEAVPGAYRLFANLLGLADSPAQ